MSDTGTWPESWPAELEPLRKQARSLEGPLLPQLHYEIPFTKREEFETAWPHLLKVKTAGAPIVLLRGPVTWLGSTVNSGVRIHCPPEGTKEPQATKELRPGINSTYIVLIVDGDIVNLNRIKLPLDTPIDDERFESKKKE